MEHILGVIGTVVQFGKLRRLEREKKTLAEGVTTGQEDNHMAGHGPPMGPLRERERKWERRQGRGVSQGHVRFSGRHSALKS
jgi:hypothetical protein